MRMSRLLVGAAAAVLLVAHAATPAGAVWDPGLGGSPKATGPNTDLVLTSTGARRASPGGSIRPTPCPTRRSPTRPWIRPAPPFESRPESFAGVINSKPSGAAQP